MIGAVDHLGDRLMVWTPDPSLWVTVLWGAPTVADLRAMVVLHDRAYTTAATFDSVVDFRGVTIADPLAFDVLVEFTRKRRDEFERQITRQALVRPPGMIGALVTGFFDSFGFRLPVRAFDDRETALAWVRPEVATVLEHEIAARLAAATLAPALREVRDTLARDHGRTMSITWCARAIGVSVRTLQRQLQDARTSFRTELTNARIEAAKALLRGAECKLAAVALEVGFSTQQAFAAAFRAHTGETPTAWRQRRLASPAMLDE